MSRAPEVVQSSAMDCGPAALAAFLRGHGIGVSYPRLRELCQTGVDGTSIDVLEEIACALGFPAEQVVVPAEFVAVDEANLGSIVVTLLPDGFTHFVVAWRRRRGRITVMDPAVGRRTVPVDQFVEVLFQFPLEVDADEFAASSLSSHLSSHRMETSDCLGRSAGATPQRRPRRELDIWPSRGLRCDALGRLCGTRRDHVTHR